MRLGNETIRCARCRAVLSPGAKCRDEVAPPVKGPPVDSGLQGAVVPMSHTAATLCIGRPPIDLDDWQLDEELHLVQRWVRTASAVERRWNDSGTAPDAAHHRLPATHASYPNLAAKAGLAGRTRRTCYAKRLFSWAIMSLSVMMFACGSVLLAWSLFTGRDDLWSLGLPLTLAGQAGLIIGLVMQLEGLWQSNRETSSTLDELDDQLKSLRHATTLLSTTHGSFAQSFYVHMAEGASPQLMLADLKGQLDMLALKLANQQ